MVTNDAGIKLIKEFEGLRLKAYPDPGTGGAPWTIGYGSTFGVTKGMTITAEQAETMLRRDLKKFEGIVTMAVTVPLNENQFAALVSFAYNCGPKNLLDSTLLKRVNAGRFKDAADEFSKWNKAAGRVMPGLTRRRDAERALFLTPVANPGPTSTPAPAGLFAKVAALLKR